VQLCKPRRQLVVAEFALTCELNHVNVLGYHVQEICSGDLLFHLSQRYILYCSMIIIPEISNLNSNIGLL